MYTILLMNICDIFSMCMIFSLLNVNKRCLLIIIIIIDCQLTEWPVVLPQKVLLKLVLPPVECKIFQFHRLTNAP